MSGSGYVCIRQQDGFPTTRFVEPLLVLLTKWLIVACRAEPCGAWAPEPIAPVDLVRPLETEARITKCA
eukprot:scaffold650834_cov39-Prasinocladus_malaysianus.AAC.1